MNQIIIHTERCKGCGYCVHFCPKGALSVSAQINEKGYNPVAVDESRCVLCGVCYNVCPDYVFEVTREG